LHQDQKVQGEETAQGPQKVPTAVH